MPRASAGRGAEARGIGGERHRHESRPRQARISDRNLGQKRESDAGMLRRIFQNLLVRLYSRCHADKDEKALH